MVSSPTSGTLPVRFPCLLLGHNFSNNSYRTAEEQGVLDPKAPKYVNKRGDIAGTDEEEARESTGTAQYGAMHSPAGN